MEVCLLRGKGEKKGSASILVYGVGVCFYYWAISANSSEFDRAENSLNFSGHGTILNFPS